MGLRQTELNDSRILSAAAFLCSVAVLAAAMGVTLAIASGSAEILRWPFRLMCHGQLDRAFEMADMAMPLCARCVGVYTGIAGAALAMFAAPPQYRSRVLLVLGAVLVVPMVIDGSAQTLGLWSTGNVARAATGLAFGLGLVILAINGVASRQGRASELAPATMGDTRSHGAC